MAVPKKRTGKSAQGKRRANWKATVPATTTCKQCGGIVLTHTVCPECGSYKGNVVSIKNASSEASVEVQETKKAEEAQVKETKPKRTRKATKKAEEIKEEVKIESEEAQASDNSEKTQD